MQGVRSNFIFISEPHNSFKMKLGPRSHVVVRVSGSVVVIPFLSELELELYLLRKEAELELAELNQHLELAPPLESVPLLELAPGIQCLGHSN